MKLFMHGKQQGAFLHSECHFTQAFCSSFVVIVNIVHFSPLLARLLSFCACLIVLFCLLQVLPFSIKHAMAHKYYARAAKFLLKQTEEKSSKAADTQLVEVMRMMYNVCIAFNAFASFQYTGPVVWNSLPPSLRHSSSISSLKSKLKTRLFSSAY